jgi:uncharacterized Zn finger protein
MAGNRWQDWERYPSSTPIRVEDGITTSKRRGAMASTWWSQRFTTVLESFMLGGRMQRGRRYARTGQTLSFEVRPGQLLGQVQGSRSTPYLVTVDSVRPSDEQWAAVDAAMAARVGFIARLLAGEVPEDLEDAFTAAGVALFPRHWSDLDARCSCPDDANPCKHIAAVLYVFADRLDDDPWLLLAWRGRTREQVLEPLSRLATKSATTASLTTTGRPEAALPPWWPLEPTSNGEATVAGEPTYAMHEPNLLDVSAPDPADAVLRRLAALPVVARRLPAVDHLATAYRAIIDG